MSPGADSASRIHLVAAEEVYRREVPGIVGSSAVMRSVLEDIHVAVKFPHLSVLVVGETGTGKELVVRAIHQLCCSSEPLQAVNCAALSTEFFEHELFGHAAMAPKGEGANRLGLFELAAEGTVFLDELGEMPSSLQAKLLRVLEFKRFRRVGSSAVLPLRARVIGAMSRPFRDQCGDTLRPDLFFRLAEHLIRLPPLREHLEDIEELVVHFLRQFTEQYCNESPSDLHMTGEGLACLRRYAWPGNVRELKTVVFHCAARARNSSLGTAEVIAALRARGVREPLQPLNSEIVVAKVSEIASEQQPEGLRELERKTILQAFEACSRNVSVTARRLGVPRSTLRDKLRRLGAR